MELQTVIAFQSSGEERKEEGMRRAVEKADRVVPNWSERAYQLLEDYVLTVSTFLCEDFRAWCLGRIEEPPHQRAFGSIISRAQKRELIAFVKYAKVKNIRAHQANAAVWRRKTLL